MQAPHVHNLQMTFNGIFTSALRLNHCVLIHAWLYSAMNRITTTLVLLLVRMSKEPGWLEGFLNGKQGLVPANYVVYIEWRHWSGASALNLSSSKSHQTCVVHCRWVVTKGYCDDSGRAKHTLTIWRTVGVDFTPVSSDACGYTSRSLGAYCP